MPKLLMSHDSVHFDGGDAITKTEVVRQWSGVAWDLAREQVFDPEGVADEWDRLEDEDWDREADLLEQLNTGPATKLWQDLLGGAVFARNALGKPLPVLNEQLPELRQ